MIVGPIAHPPYSTHVISIYKDMYTYAYIYIYVYVYIYIYSYVSRDGLSQGWLIQHSRGGGVMSISAHLSNKRAFWVH